MINVDLEVKNNVLTVMIDLSEEHGRSKSGKTIIVASTQGNQRLEGTTVVLGLNAFKYPEQA